MMLTLAKSPIADIRVLDARIREERPLDPLDDISCDGAPSRHLIVSRWSGGTPDTGPQRAQSFHGYHTIGISMENTQVRLSLSDRLLYEGTIEAGTVQISGPDRPIMVENRGPYNWIRLHVGNDFLLKCQSMLQSSARGAPVSVNPELTFCDAVVYDLIRVLERLSDASTTISSLGVESVILAIILRILARNAGSYPPVSTPRTKPLIAWRLRRVKDYIATRLADPISLPDLAQAAGLTRMHFAAQFKAATGLRPREYVLKHRIGRAKTLLLESELKLVEIALASGFQTQAHFTTVFKKLTFSTPYEWRCRERDRHAVQPQVPRINISAFDAQRAKSRHYNYGDKEFG